MERFTIKPDLQPEEVAKRITDMQVSDVIMIEQYGWTEQRTMDKNKSNLVMIVHRIVGGWIYEMLADESGVWQPVFVPDQVNWAEEITAGINGVLGLSEGVLQVRQV